MITVLGSINIDLVSLADRLPGPGETLSGKEFYTSPGGKGETNPWFARRAGSDVRMVGTIGADDFGSAAISALQDEGVGLSAVKRSAGSTGTAAIYVEDGGENTVIVVPGAHPSITSVEAVAAGRR